MSSNTSSQLVLTACIAAAASAVVTAALLGSFRRKSVPLGGVLGGKVDPSSCTICTCGDCGARQKADPYEAAGRSIGSFLSWDDYFLSLAFLSAQRSKDPNKQVGACIVSQNHIILGIGYNGFPRGCPDLKLPWAKKSRSNDPLQTKYPYVVHAEMNAVLNTNSASLNGAKLYVTMFPCNECAKLLIQAGISEVIFSEDKDLTGPRSQTEGGIRPDQAYAASKKLLAMANVKLRQHRLQGNKNSVCPGLC